MNNSNTPSQYLADITSQVEIEGRLLPSVQEEFNWVRRDFELKEAKGEDTCLAYIEARAQIDRIRIKGVKGLITKRSHLLNKGLESCTIGATHKLTDATEDLELFYSTGEYSDCPLFERVELDGREIDPADYNITYNQLQAACEEDCANAISDFRYTQRGGE